jgi:hemerythrin-like domain-containing protein
LSEFEVPTSYAASTSTLRARPTPDDGRRLTEHELWDEAARPLAPAIPAGRDYSDRGQQVAALLLDVHGMLRSELRGLRDVLAGVEGGESTVGDARATVQAMTLRRHDWALGAYCAHYCRFLTEHHGIESEWVFPHLARSEAALAPVMDRLQSEHEVIHGVVERVDRALVALARDDTALGGVREAVDLLTDLLLSHLSYEESQILDPLARFGFAPGQV